MAASSSQLPPAQPKSILRGHQAQVHTAAFVRAGRRLATGDADGYVVLWDLAIMRPRVVWRAHANAVLRVAAWGRSDKIITHGRDNKLIVWNITANDEARLSAALPLDPSSPSPRPQPWVLHVLEVNTMNFCSFASCPAGVSGTSDDELLVAVPNTLASESVDIYHLPSQDRVHTVQPPGKGDEKLGMVMALALFRRDDDDASLTLVTAYENGLATVVQQDGATGGPWHLLYRAQAHSQPVLSLDVSCDGDYFLTSGADALLVKHPVPRPPKTASSTSAPQKAPVSLSSSAPLPGPQPAKPSPKRGVEVATAPLKVVNTKHAGQQSLRLRPDGKIFATAGWDARVRVYSARNLRELAVLKWHRTGCYAVAFAPSGSEPGDDDETKPSERGDDAAADQRRSLVPQVGDLTVKERRIRQAEEAHWLAVGGKDGKISLWDIY